MASALEPSQLVDPTELITEPAGLHECEEEEFEPDVVLFTFFMLLIGLVTMQFLRKVPIPYTALLLIIGLGFGFLHKALSHVGESEQNEGHDPPLEDYVWESGYKRLGIGIQIWAGISPELLLLLFLPPLIFASGFSLDFHILKRVFGQVLLLAGPGVIIGTVLVALIAKYLLPYHWCWPKAFLFGAMLSATDPVAVVALLKDVGASAKLGHVIEGESLFNDGTAFVFFLLFRDMIPVTDSCQEGQGHEGFHPGCASEERGVGDSIGFFARLALGGPALGLACGIVTTLWIKFIFSNLFLEISLTLVSAYLTFYLAEDILEVSGVLAVVAFGIFMGTFAKDRVSSRVHEPLHVFWEMMEYFANTMIFVFTGLKVAIGIAEKDEIAPRDWGWAIFLYVALNVIRGLTILVLYPFLKRIGYGITFKDSIVMTWGGLRGAVGLALALIVELDEKRLPPKFRALVIFHMGLMAAFTLIINGTTMPYLLRFLGTTKTSPEKLEVLLHVIKDLEDSDTSKLECDSTLGYVDTKKVLEYANINVDRILPRKKEICQVVSDAMEAHNPAVVGFGDQLSFEDLSRVRARDAQQDTLPRVDPSQTSISVDVPADEMPESSLPHGIGNFLSVKVTKEMLIKDVRSKMLQSAKATYAKWLEEILIGANQNFDLKEATDKALDHLDEPLRDWDHLEKLARVPSWCTWIQRFQTLQIPLVKRCLLRILFNSVEHTVLCARAFIQAHTDAQQKIREHTKPLESSGDSEQSRISQNLFEAADLVIKESEAQVELAKNFIMTVKRAYPEIARSIRSKMAAQHILLEKMDCVQNMKHGGLIEAREAQQLEALISRQMKRLAFHPPQLELPDPQNLLYSHPLFSEISRTVFDAEVMPFAKPRVFNEKAAIFKEASRANHISIVIRGIVHVYLQGKLQRQEGTGAIVGLSEVLLDQPRARALIADTIVEVYQIEADVFRGLVARHPAIAKRAWQNAAAFLTVLHPWGEFRDASFDEVQKHFRRSEIEELQKGDNIRIRGEVFLLQGCVLEVKLDGRKRDVIEAPAHLGPALSVFVCTSVDGRIARIPSFTQQQGLESVSWAHRSLSALHRPSFKRLSQRLMAQSQGLVSKGLSGIPETGVLDPLSSSRPLQHLSAGVEPPPKAHTELSKSDSAPTSTLVQLSKDQEEGH